MIARRLLLLGAACSLAGCATRSLEECDPHTGGPIDYMQCRDQYVQRQRLGQQRIAQDEAHLQSEQAETRVLQQQVASLNAQLSATEAEIDQLRARRAALEGRLERLTAPGREMSDYVSELDAYLGQLNAANVNVVAYHFPSPPDDARARAVYGSFLDAQRAAADRAARIRQARTNIAEAFAELVADTLTLEGFKFVVKRILRDLALDEIEPLVGVVATLKDGYDAYKFVMTARANLQTG